MYSKFLPFTPAGENIYNKRAKRELPVTSQSLHYHHPPTIMHLLQTKTANNSVMHIGTNMIFGGILEGVQIIYYNIIILINKRNFDCATLDARVKVE